MNPIDKLIEGLVILKSMEVDADICCHHSESLVVQINPRTARLRPQSTNRLLQLGWTHDHSPGEWCWSQ